MRMLISCNFVMSWLDMAQVRHCIYLFRNSRILIRNTRPLKINQWKKQDTEYYHVNLGKSFNPTQFTVDRCNWFVLPTIVRWVYDSYLDSSLQPPALTFSSRLPPLAYTPTGPPPAQVSSNLDPGSRFPSSGSSRGNPWKSSCVLHICSILTNDFLSLYFNCKLKTIKWVLWSLSDWYSIF